MIEKLYSDFDPPINVKSKKGKSFSEKDLPLSFFHKFKEIKTVSRAIEETVVLKHQKKWVNATMIGVDTSFLSMSKMKKHIVSGTPDLEFSGKPHAIVGATLMDQLDAFISDYQQEILTIYYPKRNMKIRFGKNPFRSKNIFVAAKMNFNKEINRSTIVVPLSFAKNLLRYEDRITSYFMALKKGVDKNQFKLKLQKKLGNKYKVFTDYEKNELIYKTSKTEKIIVLIILLFIFILAAFNLIASITVLFTEKEADIHTMISFGANKQFIFNIFFYEGLLIAFKGIFYGLILGYGICLLQLKLELLTLPNTGGEVFPIRFSISDGILIFISVSLLSVLLSYLPVKYLVHRFFTTAKKQ